LTARQVCLAVKTDISHPKSAGKSETASVTYPEVATAYSHFRHQMFTLCASRQV
jgi:hypothetical protein